MILPSPATQEICTRNSTKRDTQQVLVNFVRLMNRCYYSPDFVAGWKETGSIYLARTEDRLMYYKRSLASAKYIIIRFLVVDPFCNLCSLCVCVLRIYGVEDGEIWTPEQVEEKLPNIRTNDLLVSGHYSLSKTMCSIMSSYILSYKGAVYIPGDGVVSVPDASTSMARKAKDLGTSISSALTLIFH